MSSEGDRIKITSKINSIWKSNSCEEKYIDTNEFINDYNNIIVKINDFNLSFGDIVDVTRFKSCYDTFIYNWRTLYASSILGYFLFFDIIMTKISNRRLIYGY